MPTKTVAIIVNHNLPEYTNWLYRSLSEYQDDSFDLLVMDNGSKPELIPEIVNIRNETNLFWGGALNIAFDFVLKNTQYDSLLFLNNDIDVNASIFVQALRSELFKNHFAIVTPCIAGMAQPWKQMMNWGSKKTRTVKWIDNQAPLFHRKIIEAIGQFDPELQYGWGQELVCYDICKERRWKIGVCDHISMLHFGMQTLVQKRLFSQGRGYGNEAEEIAIDLENFKREASNSYINYFAEHPLRNGKFDELRSYGESYSYFPGNPDQNPMNKIFHRLSSMAKR
ncbi:MAG: hypothetical protein M0P58_09800 [Bacteroidales bacterium]|nr:hypothetical protein [Bacteroidales bacterium]